jgi:hypothetical protein
MAERLSAIVMAGLDPAIYVFLWAMPQDVDGRNKSGHDSEAMPGAKS